MSSATLLPPTCEFAKMNFDISAALASGTLVKANPVRYVVKSGNFYLKVDTRNNRSFKKEYLAGKLLEERGIPTVKTLAYGRIPQGNILITQAWENSLTAAEYLRDNYPDQKFLHGLTNLTLQLFASKIFHGDYHLGNILYQPETGKFALVDLCSIRRSRWFDCFKRYRMYRIIMELRSKLHRRELEILLAEIGVMDPEKFYFHALKKEAKALWKEWPKRRKQILDGYPKFTVKTPELLLVSPNSSIPSEPGETGSVMEVVAHWFLELAGIPHRKVLAFRYKDSQVWYGGKTAGLPPEISADEYIQRLNFYGITTAKDDWCGDEHNHIQCVALKSIAEKLS